LVPLLSTDLVEKGLKGRDMLKQGFVSKQDDDNDDDDDDEDSPGRKWMSVSTPPFLALSLSLSRVADQRV
jgi:hypothetical protein